ncbi:MAG: ATP synthase subunit I [Pyrinomonadaceae bacterium]
MSEVTDSDAALQEPPTPISNRRIIWMMAIVIVLGTLASFIFVSNVFGIGYFIGGVLSFVNYFWLKSSLKKMFVETTEGEHKPHYSAARYITRYFTIGAVLALIFLTHTVPIAAVILGVASFAFAIIIEAFIRIFSFFFRREGI